MSYGSNLGYSLHQVGIYTGRILKGEKPSDLPVQQITKIESSHQPQNRQGTRPHHPGNVACHRGRGDSMKRREFIAGLGSAAAWPVAVRAEQGERMRRIAVLMANAEDDPFGTSLIKALAQALEQLGWIRGRDVEIDTRWTGANADRIQIFAAELVSLRPDVILANATPLTAALQRETNSIPIIFLTPSDPIGSGFVASLARPGGNITGVSFSDAALGGKRLELITDALPEARRIAVIWSRSFASNTALIDAIKEAARAGGVEIIPREFHGVDDLPSAFDDAKASGAQAAIFMTDNVMFGRRKEVADLALARRLPSIHSFAPEAKDGAFMSFGPDLDESYRRTAALADAILRGRRPADLPVEEPTRFTLALNLKTAAALGIIVPPSILVGANRVIE